MSVLSVSNPANWSLPARERGLKHLIHRQIRRCPQSLPARERGLKLAVRDMRNHIEQVAPRAGAWIET